MPPAVCEVRGDEQRVPRCEPCVLSALASWVPCLQEPSALQGECCSPCLMAAHELLTGFSGETVANVASLWGQRHS